MRVATSLLFALALGAVAACGDDPVSPQAEALAQANALWNRTKPASNSYTYDQQVMCFCPYGAQAFRVTVTSGVITRVVDTQAAADLPATQFGRFRTIDQLFSEVRVAITKSGVLTAVEYHPTMGFPSKVSLDPVKNAVDDEVAYFTAFVAASS